MRKIVLVLGLAAIGGCDEVLGRVADVSAIVRVVDERDDPLRADEVVWYYPTDSE